MLWHPLIANFKCTDQETDTEVLNFLNIETTGCNLFQNKKSVANLKKGQNK